MTKTAIFLLLILLLATVNLGWVWQSGVAKKNRLGNKLYSEGKIDDALSKWRDAQIESPDKKELHYNIGNALHEQKKYEDAFNEYEKVLDSEDATLQSKTYYNIGNTHYRMGKLLEAIEDYKKCLEMTPDDEDAKYNIEFIRKKLKENLEKQKQQQEMANEGHEQEGQAQEQQAQEQQAQQQEAQESQALEKEEKDTEKKEAGEEGKEETMDERRGTMDEQRQGTNDERSTTRAEKGDMSEEDAYRLLDALRDDEKELQKELRIQQGEGRYRVERDW